MPQINEQKWFFMDFKITMMLGIMTMMLNYSLKTSKNESKTMKKYLFQTIF